MSPRAADPVVRTALVDAAARILATDGPGALSTRRLATEVGTSTMAVYTHFGNMTALRRAVRGDGFTRLAAELDALPATGDPVADLGAAGSTYVAYGMDHPELYRAMFVDQPPDGDDDPGAALFTGLVDAVVRCVDAGRFDPASATTSLTWAAEIWTARHGLVMLALTGLLGTEPIAFLLTDTTYRLVVGFGDEPARARRSLEHAGGR